MLETVAHLATVADGDTVYRDVHLRRAAQLLSPIITEAQYDAALARREQLGRMLAQARAAVERRDWSEVRELGTRAENLRSSLDAEQSAIAAAEAVYGVPGAVLDPFSPGLPRSKRWPDPNGARSEVSAALGALGREDVANRDLYAARQRAIDAIALPHAVSADDAGGRARASGIPIEQQALQALERGDAGALRALADAMLRKGEGVRDSAETGAPVARGRLEVPPVLGEPLPDACLPRAHSVGLEPMETTLAAPALAAAITSFVERYALGASPTVYDRASDGVARITVAAEEADIPPNVAAVFAETISLFALHQFVNSAGVRYAPVPARREVLLLETHAEGDEARTPLLQELGLERRRALSRDTIERHLLKHGGRIVGERLGLDPHTYRLVCVPPDVFIRVGQARGWGQREEWTHLDGYQVLSGGRLRALVGGNARFGGIFDLCSLGRDDARANTVLRLAVIRRERLAVRIG